MRALLRGCWLAFGRGIIRPGAAKAYMAKRCCTASLCSRPGLGLMLLQELIEVLEDGSELGHEQDHTIWRSSMSPGLSSFQVGYSRWRLAW